ncbi:MAG: hypothetical protein NC548_28195 [Lachnospiraceae bacterium]|nr:hypothetical protein [Lachnospiraceae bacterium]
MTQKTNQFNLTTHRYTEADINDFLSKGNDVYCISVSYKFGDNGITGEIIITKQKEEAMIDTLLLSCRILGKDIEKAFVKSVLNILFDSGVKVVKASYIPTAKNAQEREFYDKLGFMLVSESEGVREYELRMSGHQDISDCYNIMITRNYSAKG